MQFEFECNLIQVHVFLHSFLWIYILSDLLQPSEKQTLLSARLFPVAHPHGSIGWSHTLWLCGAVNIPDQLHRYEI